MALGLGMQIQIYWVSFQKYQTKERLLHAICILAGRWSNSLFSYTIFFLRLPPMETRYRNKYLICRKNDELNEFFFKSFRSLATSILNFGSALMQFVFAFDPIIMQGINPFKYMYWFFFLEDDRSMQNSPNSEYQVQTNANHQYFVRAFCPVATCNLYFDPCGLYLRGGIAHNIYKSINTGLNPKLEQRGAACPDHHQVKTGIISMRLKYLKQVQKHQRAQTKHKRSSQAKSEIQNEIGRIF